MSFKVEVYSKENGVCVDSVEVSEIRSIGCFYELYPSFNEKDKSVKEYDINKYELSTKSFLDIGKTLIVKTRFDRLPLKFPNVQSYNKVDYNDGLDGLRIEYRPWGQDRIYVYIMHMSLVDNWEEK